MAVARSGWFWAGVGCLGVIIFCVVCTAGVGLVAVRGLNEIRDSFEDPARRDENAKSALGTETLPEGYYPLIGLEAPLSLGKLVVLSDVPPTSDGAAIPPRERGFVYVEMPSFGGNREEVRDYFEGRTDDARVLRELNVNIDTDEVIGRGVLDHEDVDYLYLTTRGNVGIQGHAGTGLAAVSLVECLGDSRLRIAVWFGPDPDPGTPVEELDLTGTAADPEALDAFLEHFSLCG